LFISFIQRNPQNHLPHHQSHLGQLYRAAWSAGTRVSRQSNPTVSVTMEAETQTEEEQVNIIEPRSGPITPMDIGNFAPGTDSLGSDAEIENHERKKILKSCSK
jgi:hypothetical protein